MNLKSLRDCYTIDRAWRDLGLRGEPAGVCRSPFPNEHKNGDAHPSFSIYDNGKRAKDFTTSEHFDVFDFIRKVRGCDLAEAIRFVEERLGIPRPQGKSTTTYRGRSRIPTLRHGTESELRQLATRRCFSVNSLRLTEQRGFLWFTNLWGYAAWCITDVRSALFEFRRLDGQMWPAYGRLQERKAHCMGAGKHWPLGMQESEPFSKIVIVEGGPDFLAAFHFMLIEGKERDIAPVGILGASNHRLAPEALVQFKGKSVCFYPHVDDSGRTATQIWARQAKDAGAARVTAFDLSGLVLMDGSTGKDLADVCQISADCLERESKFTEVLP